MRQTSLSHTPSTFDPRRGTLITSMHWQMSEFFLDLSRLFDECRQIVRIDQKHDLSGQSAMRM